MLFSEKEPTMIKSIKSILTKDEKVLCNNRVHWIVFSNPVLYGLIGLAVGVFFHPAVGGLILFMNLYPIYMSTVMYLTTHLVLTDTKVLGRTGFLSRDWQQLNLSRIESAYLVEPILGRFLGYSTVMVSGTGAGAIAFPYIVDGDVFIKKLEKLLAKREEKIEIAA